jgi:hypothetical protein
MLNVGTIEFGKLGPASSTMIVVPALAPAGVPAKLKTDAPEVKGVIYPPLIRVVGAHAGTNRFGSLTRLWAAATKVKAQSTLGRPRSLVLRSPPTVFIQPNASPIRLPIRWLAA